MVILLKRHLIQRKQHLIHQPARKRERVSLQPVADLPDGKAQRVYRCRAYKVAPPARRVAEGAEQATGDGIQGGLLGNRNAQLLVDQAPLF